MGEFSHHFVAGRPVIAGLAVVLAAIALPPHAEADTQTCRYDISTDTVLDHDTGLTWQKTLDGASYTFSNAISYCQNLQLAGGGWRLPSIQELQTLVDDSKYDPAINSAAFPSTPSDYFWSSSVYADGPGYAWIVYFTIGNADYVGVGGAHRVRCVR